MPALREIVVRKRCLAAVLIAYAIIIVISIVIFGQQITSVSHLLPVSWTLVESINSRITNVVHSVDEKATGQYSNVVRSSIAIGLGITSKGLNDLNINNMVHMLPLFKIFIPSFCETASPGFTYHFYLGYDQNDPFFINATFLSTFKSTFMTSISQLCTGNMTVSIHTVRCSHDGKPTWAQNDALLEAYLDNADYYYRINDDTKMITKDWTEMFLEVLRAYVPINVGVVGPKHYGGNTLILTYDFVHKTHVEIFGFYYPRLFRDWWGDDWITNVYLPYRSTKHQKVYLEHTMGMGRRYNISQEISQKLVGQVAKDTGTLQRYINYTRIKDSIKVDGKKVIAMSLYGNNPKYSWGAIRNAQIAPIFFPGWKLRIYVTSYTFKAADIKSWLVPKRILNKLKQLGAEIEYVKTKSIPPVFWRYLVVDDESVNYFIIRNAHSRLSERDAIVVNEWLNHQDLNSDVNSLHCIRDHTDHANQSIIDGLWGGKRVTVQRLLRKSMVTVLEEFMNSTYLSERQNPVSVFLSDFVWPLVSLFSYCHDSVSCGKWTGIHGFQNKRLSNEYIGQEFDEHEEPTSIFST